MNDQQIHVLMAKTPDIRAVQISDALDKPLAEVSQALRALVEVGDIIAGKGFAPNGHQAQVYNHSAAFMKSKEYPAVLAIAAGQKPAAAAAAGAPSPVAARPAPVSASAAIPVFVPAGQQTSIGAEQSVADLGIAYIVKHGAVLQGDLRVAMKLSATNYPSSYLATAIQHGKVHKDGNTWRAGPAGKKQLPVSVFQAKAETPSLAATVAAHASTAPIFRCGLWSDGVLELQRNGSTVAVLEQKEGEHLASFVNRMLLDPLGIGVQTSAQRP